MNQVSSTSSALYQASKLIFILLSFTLWIDALTGMIQYYGSISLKLSLLYKIPMIALMILIIGAKSRWLCALIMCVILLFVIGPFTQFLSSPKVSYFINDISLAIKMVTPFIVFSFCKIISDFNPELLGKYGVRALWINFFAVLFNLIIGALGFGYPSYAGTGDGEGIGVNGFYVAGNELGGCFVLLFGFVMHYLWNQHRIYFYPMGLVTLVCGALIATKTAMVASLVLCFAIPLFNERQNFFRFTKLKAKLFIPLILLFGGIIYFIVELLEAIGLYDKMMFFLSEKGVLGIILSGRLEFSVQIIEAFESYAGVFQYLFGIGMVGMSEFFHSKYSAEVDPVDLYVYIGITGSLLVYTMLVVMILPALSVFKKGGFFPPLIILINLLLVMLAFFSGHILTSGMLGLIWGLLNALVYVKYKEDDVENEL